MAWYHRLFNLTRGDDLSRELDREMFHIAELLPAWRAARLDPMNALRLE